MAKLRQIAVNIQYGISRSISDNKAFPKLLRITDIQEGMVDWANVPRCECNEKEEKNYLLKDGDIVFTRTGATTGKSFLVRDPQRSLFASYLIRLQCDHETVSPDYLYFFFHSPIYWRQISQDSRGGTLAGFNATMLSKMKISLPPTLEDQMAITNDLKQKMDEVERVRQAVLHQKEAIAVMQGAILREVFPYKEGDKIPVGWRWKPLGEVCLINPPKKRGFSRNPNTSTSFVPMEAVDELKGTIGKRIIRPFSEVGKGYTFFEDGDVLFAKITPCMQNGKSAIADNLIDGIGFGSTEFHVLRAKIDITKEWIYHFVRSVEFRKRAQEHFEGSAGQQRVPTEFIEKSLIPLPPSLDEQIKITNELHRKMAEVEKMRQAIDREYGAVQALPGAILQEVFDFEQE